MNSDVLPPCGGYLSVRIDQGGYIYNLDGYSMVHLETRRMQNWVGWFDSFSEARDHVLSRAYGTDRVALLQLTPEGGGEALWTRPEFAEEIEDLRNKHRGCYGTWPVQTFTI